MLKTLLTDNTKELQQCSKERKNIYNSIWGEYVKYVNWWEVSKQSKKPNSKSKKHDFITSNIIVQKKKLELKPLRLMHN